MRTDRDRSSNLWRAACFFFPVPVGNSLYLQNKNDGLSPSFFDIPSAVAAHSAAVDSYCLLGLGKRQGLAANVSPFAPIIPIRRTIRLAIVLVSRRARCNPSCAWSSRCTCRPS